MTLQPFADLALLLLIIIIINNNNNNNSSTITDTPIRPKLEEGFQALRPNRMGLRGLFFGGDDAIVNGASKFFSIVTAAPLHALLEVLLH